MSADRVHPTSGELWWIIIVAVVVGEVILIAVIILAVMFVIWECRLNVSVSWVGEVLSGHSVSDGEVDIRAFEGTGRAEGP
jgi:hypothetical protein